MWPFRLPAPIALVPVDWLGNMLQMLHSLARWRNLGFGHAHEPRAFQQLLNPGKEYRYRWSLFIASQTQSGQFEPGLPKVEARCKYGTEIVLKKLRHSVSNRR